MKGFPHGEKGPHKEKNASHMEKSPQKKKTGTRRVVPHKEKKGSNGEKVSHIEKKGPVHGFKKILVEGSAYSCPLLRASMSAILA